MSGEVQRSEYWPHKTADARCIICGATLVLFFNGGELDERTCCGYRYSLEHVRIDLVVYKQDPPVRRRIDLVGPAQEVTRGTS